MLSPTRICSTAVCKSLLRWDCPPDCCRTSDRIGCNSGHVTALLLLHSSSGSHCIEQCAVVDLVIRRLTSSLSSSGSRKPNRVKDTTRTEFYKRYSTSCELVLNDLTYQEQGSYKLNMVKYAITDLFYRALQASLK